MHEVEISLGELPLSGDERRAPSEFRIAAAGETKTRKGPVWFDSTAAELVMAEHAADPRPLAVDYEHAHIPSFNAPPSEKRAAGWFRPEVRNGELWATDVEWTPAGRKAVEDKEFRFVSLWADGQKEGARVRLSRLRNVALTNTPAVIGSVPLVQSEGPNEVAMPDALQIALGCSDESQAITKIGALSLVMNEAESVTGKKDHAEIVGALRGMKLRADRAAELELELSELKVAGEKRDRDALILKLTEDGKLPPALKSWAGTIPMSALIAFSEAAPALINSDPSKEPREPAAGANLDPAIKLELERAGLTETQYREAQAAGAV